MVYFTGDEHYGHRNVIKYCNRPFQDVDEMDREIIKRHNEVVGDDDTVYHLGDFTINKKKIDEEHRMAKEYLKKVFGKEYFSDNN